MANVEKDIFNGEEFGDLAGDLWAGVEPKAEGPTKNLGVLAEEVELPKVEVVEGPWATMAEKASTGANWTG